MRFTYSLFETVHSDITLNNVNEMSSYIKKVSELSSLQRQPPPSYIPCWKKQVGQAGLFLVAAYTIGPF